MTADSIDNVYQYLSPTPLLTCKELEEFYSDCVNAVRGQDVVARLKLGLHQTDAGSFYKAFLVGHPGVGKSTELTRLICDVDDRFRALRFSATTELDPGSFQPFDILLLILADLIETVAGPKDKGGLGKPPPDDLSQSLWSWFATEEETTKAATGMAVEAAGGLGVPKDAWQAKILGLFAHIKGEVKYASSRQKERVEYRLKRLSTLIEIANRVLDFANTALDGDRRWIIIGEDFDKPGIPPSLIRQLFVVYANLFKDLRTHLIFTIPAGLAHSSQAPQLPFAADRVLFVPDTPVYRQDHQAHREGRDALLDIVRERIDLGLLQEGQLMRLMVASGGNLRELFAMLKEAADHAILRGNTTERTIGPSDVDRAINKMRAEYVGRLGRSQFDEDEQIGYDEKAERLRRLYAGEPKAQVADPILYSLLRSRTVQEFNGKRWYGVHPLVVDILREQGVLTPDADGRMAGGLA